MEPAVVVVETARSLLATLILNTHVYARNAAIRFVNHRAPRVGGAGAVNAADAYTGCPSWATCTYVSSAPTMRRAANASQPMS